MTQAASSNKHARLVALAAKVFVDKHPLLETGVGNDDCAVVALTGRKYLLSCDMRNHRRYVETHAAVNYAEMGAFVVRQNCADIYGSGGAPMFMLLVAVLPADISEANVFELFEGVRREAARFDAAVIGGDTKEGSALVVGCTVFGRVNRRPWLLSGACVGDDVYVSGPLGGATAAVTLLELHPHANHRTAALEALRNADINVAQLRVIEALDISCGTDISDGLARALHNIARQSTVGIAIAANLVPLHPLASIAAKQAGLDPRFFALGYGGDFEFVLTAKPEFRARMTLAGFSLVGEVTSSGRCEIDWGNGQMEQLEDFGHDDFTDISPGLRFTRHWSR